MLVEVGEFSSPSYPSLEGGFTVEVDDLETLLAELREEYPVVGSFGINSEGAWVKVYENE